MTMVKYKKEASCLGAHQAPLRAPSLPAVRVPGAPGRLRPRTPASPPGDSPVPRRPAGGGDGAVPAWPSVAGDARPDGAPDAPAHLRAELCLPENWSFFPWRLSAPSRPNSSPCSSGSTVAYCGLHWDATGLRRDHGGELAGAPDTGAAPGRPRGGPDAREAQLAVPSAPARRRLLPLALCGRVGSLWLRWKPVADLGHCFQRAARDAPLVTRAYCPIGARGVSAVDCGAGRRVIGYHRQHFSFILLFIPAPCTCRRYGDPLAPQEKILKS